MDTQPIQGNWILWFLRLREKVKECPVGNQERQQDGDGLDQLGIFKHTCGNGGARPSA